MALETDSAAVAAAGTVVEVLGDVAVDVAAVGVDGA